MALNDRYGKEAFKLVMDLEVVVSACQSQISVLSSKTSQLETLLANFNQNDITTLQSDVQTIYSAIQNLQTAQQTLSSSISSISTRVSDLEQNYVPKTRKINNKTLDQDIELTFSDVGLQNMTSSDVDTYYDN